MTDQEKSLVPHKPKDKLIQDPIAEFRRLYALDQSEAKSYYDELLTPEQRESIGTINFDLGAGIELAEVGDVTVEEKVIGSVGDLILKELEITIITAEKPAPRKKRISKRKK